MKSYAPRRRCSTSLTLISGPSTRTGEFLCINVRSTKTCSSGPMSDIRRTAWQFRTMVPGLHSIGKTADRHIQNAYRKIGVSSRAAATCSLPSTASRYGENSRLGGRTLSPSVVLKPGECPRGGGPVMTQQLITPESRLLRAGGTAGMVDAHSMAKSG